MKRIVVFASGSGTNAENIIKYFQKTEIASVTLLLSNNKKAKVLERAKKLSVPFLVFTKGEMNNTDLIIKILHRERPDLIILAGFLLKFPENILAIFSNKVINIHPALLPKYGGKGMYGMHVHEKVIANCEKETGITIHYVNKNYDEGAIIFQKSFLLSQNETATSLADKIHDLEYKYFPRVIEQLLTSKVKIN
ncbi:MAG: phosphoribosylglycinamide formyltransferase [Flavobacteriaceae bacterium]|jgi:phosphoribosylglycinamide formyltransferase-1|nr:phosphoribosylglycinamide formyltransferase [Flavobacteriaceae bacterium]MDG1790755.1 phosphoribosylglycinamide formyltransferase [Flavobacteriaceae bacterium]MDG2446310.1 phosphoribosylglycinamide formyltransferase [Flavobacteriaceae bacterium]